MSINASFTYEVSGTSVNFTDTSTSSTAIIEWYWEFESSGWSSDQNPSGIVFPSPGTWDVYLYIVNEDTEESELFSSITINLIDFSALPIDESDAFNIQFTDQTVGATTWDWDFGDGSVSSSQNPSHTYATEGVFEVTLITDLGDITKYIEVRDVTRSAALIVGGYNPDASRGSIQRSVDSGETWEEVYEYPGDAKITSIIAL